MTRRTEERDVRNFHSIDLRGSGTVTLIQGDIERLTVEAEEQTLPEVETVVVDGVLRLGFKRTFGFSWKPGKIDFTVWIRDLEGLRVSGSGDIRCERARSGNLELRVSGSGSIEIDELEGQRVKTNISGSGDINVVGSAGELDSTISGAGRLRAERLACQEVRAKISGSGDAFVFARDALDVRISGSGGVRYVGSPAVTSRISGSGRLSNIGTE